MKVTNKTNVPQAIVDAVSNNPYNSGDTDFSATTLVKPPQMVALERQHADEIEEDVTDMLWALMGQAMHAIIERAESDEEILTEQRLFSVINDSRISMQYDSFSMRDNVLSDFKLCSYWVGVFGIRDEWKQQLNIGAQLLRNNGYRVDGLQVVTIYRDWSLTESRRRSDYPKEQMQCHHIDLWHDDHIHQWLQSRVGLMQRAVTGSYDPCTADDMWLRDEKFAVMKTGRKSALKLFDVDKSDEAYVYARNTSGAYVEHRQGTRVRCQDYCKAAPFCEQYQQHLKETGK